MIRSGWLGACLTACLAAGCGGVDARRDASPASAAPPRQPHAAPAGAEPRSANATPDPVPAAVHGFCWHAGGNDERPLQGFAPVEQSLVALEQESGIEVALRCVVRTREQWDAFRSLSTRAAFPDSAADFRREMLLVATMGFRGNTGFSIGFGPVLARVDTVIATVVGTSPETGIQQDLVTTPVAVVSVPARPGPVLWVERADR